MVCTDSTLREDFHQSELLFLIMAWQF